VATVNGEPIPRSELDAALKMRPPIVAPKNAQEQKQLRDHVMVALVDELLLKQFLRSNSRPIESAEIDKQLKALEASLASQKRSLADYCRESRQTLEQVRANLAQMQQWTAYAATKTSEADVKNYYLANKPFFDRAMVRASHIVIRLANDAPTAERAAAQTRLTALRDEIVAGRTRFADAARQFSQCPTGSNGGDLGYIHRKWMVDESFAKAAFALETNSVSDVVTTDLGCHLILVTDKRPGTTSFFEDQRIKEAARECYMEEMRQKLIADLRAKAKIEVMSH
jgi:peptidyl-prolyl cis-trans isomerase C